ncbi:DUF4168 domain-containing protein [Kushneria marisflavi]|uniref:Uncharacterized protein n=1 Tax=Kushneria marisflavi TaxID=157779 RepID=A0A240UKV5_9GAMM|nr:DUF4168 domain-containing protein [Kushneria marisflavi]ART62131.1 hypothetical protein B9H00_02775 [Kushneria marisflavi]RKD87208.1 uncharacterized protein DUF4168 [Kushneria marisflavi]
MKRFAAVVSASLVATGLAATPALAAQEQPAQGAQSQQQSQKNFSDDQLQNFASASQEIAGISQDYTKQLQGADDADAQQSIREEANQKMVQAVQDNNLEVEQFNQIGQAVQNDPQMMQKVQQMAQKKQ